MTRTTISIDEGTLQALRLMAAERGVSIAKLVREAIDEKLTTRRVKPRSLGIGSSVARDTSRRAGEERPEPRSWR